MMRMRTKMSSPAFGTVKESTPAFGTVKESTPAFGTVKGSSPAVEETAGHWEVRPGGMLVQKRDPNSVTAAAAPVPAVRVKVKHGVVYHEIYLSSQATFGELKKLLSERTGLHPLDQKIMFKDRERDSAAYLDTAGVRDGSKLVVVEDPTAQARRIIEARRAAKAEKAAKALAAIATDVDKLAGEVLSLEAIVDKGKRVAGDDLQNLIEQLMNQLLKLDAVATDGDVKKQRGMQVRRVQKYVEKLDMLKIKNAMPKERSPQQHEQSPPRNQQPPRPPPQSQRQRPSQQQQQHSRYQNPADQQRQSHQPLVTTEWEVFDSLFSSSPSTSTPPATATIPVTSAPSRAAAISAPAPRFDWELF